MSNNSFPLLVLADWQPTRDTIRIYAHILAWQNLAGFDTAPKALGAY